MLVIKHDGTREEFAAEKLNKWAQYATKTGGNWSEIAIDTFKRLPSEVKSSDIHRTMINVCISKEDIVYSRVAARLEYAEIRKNMKRKLGVDDRDNFKDIYLALIEKGVWNKDAMPPYNPEWDEWYKEFYDTRFEYWQIAQWIDKYSRTIDSDAVETPHIGCIGIALAMHGDSIHAKNLAGCLIRGEVNLPTPALNGFRNGDKDSISCCVITGGDSVPSIGVAEHVAYMMTAKKAGIGIEFDSRSKGAPVKDGSVKHLGKHSLYSYLDKAVKAMTQVTRGGSATVTFKCIDPEVESIAMWKTQRVDIETRLDKIDYSFTYNDAFVEAVVRNQDWYLFDLKAAPEVHEAFYSASSEDYNRIASNAISEGRNYGKVNAQSLLKKFLTARNETGRVYSFNVSRANKHTPFKDTIRLSNLCQEVMLPTKAYTDMADLYSPNSIGEVAFCALSAINISKVDIEKYEFVAEVALRAVDTMIEHSPGMTQSMKNNMLKRRSAGIGITGLASFLYKNGLDYDGSKESLDTISKIAEAHYYYLLKASQKMAEESGIAVEGIDESWLPIDTRINKGDIHLDWELLRNKKRKHSVLVAHMPTESSAVFSDATNGLYPIRQKVVTKTSRKGGVQFICDSWKDGMMLAWDVDNILLSRYYSLVQDFTDQGISADYYFNPSKYSDEKKPMSELMKEWVAQAKMGNKTQYYMNTLDYNGGSVQNMKSENDVECSSCVL